VVSAGEAAYRACRLRARPCTVGELGRLGRWLFLVPHPDDEALGCGGMLHRLAESGERPLVVYLTDGAASHTGSPTWPPSRLAAARRLEALASLRVLGVPDSDVLWMNWPDAQPHPPASAAFAGERARLDRICRASRVRAIATTWSGEPHCDHAAAFALADAVSERGIALYEYLVWGWTRPDLVRQLAGRRLLRVGVEGAGPVRKRALACHRTQMTGLIGDAADAFLLPPHMAALTERDMEILIAPVRRAHAP
jgi:N-acetylglucosamine malate deacetylase 1